MESGEERLSLLERILQQLAPRNWDRTLQVVVGRDYGDDNGEQSCDDDQDDDDDDDDVTTVTGSSDEMKRQKRKQKTSNYFGGLAQTCNKENHSTWKHIQSREVGTNICGQKREGFSKSDQFCVSSRYLPNSQKQVICNASKVFCGSFSDDGSVFMSANQACHIKLYDTTVGKLEEFLDVIAQNVGWSVVDTAYSHDKRHIIYSSWSPNLYQYDITAWSQQNHVTLDMRPDDHRFCAFSITFSQDDSEILTGSNDNSLYIYDRNCGQRTLRITGHDDDVNAVSFSDYSSQLLFSGSDDGLCKVWDRRTLNEHQPEPVGVFAGHAAGITFIDSKGDGRYLITNSKDQSIKLWDLRRFSDQDCIKAARKAVNANSFWDYRWETIPGKLSRGVKVKGDPSLMTYNAHVVLRCLIRARFSPMFNTGQKYIYTGSADGAIYIYDLYTGNVVQKIDGHKTIVRDVSWHPYKQIICSASWDCTVRYWHYSRQREERERSDKEVVEDDEKENEIKKRKILHMFSL